jgi:hypothetical protein
MDDHDSIREWLKHVPDRLLNAEAGRRNSNRRRNRRGGRPKAKRSCSKCGLEMGVRELRKHHTKCKEKAGIYRENLSGQFAL